MEADKTKRARKPADTFHVEQVVAIIAACGQNGVSRFRMGDIEIDYQASFQEPGTHDLDTQRGLPVIVDLSKTPDTFVAPPDSGDIKINNQDDVYFDDDTRELFRKAELLVHDPEGFEREVIDEMLGVTDAEQDDSGFEQIT